MITLHNTSDLPEGTRLHPRTEVRFHPTDDPNLYVELYIPTTRDRGWIQVTASSTDSVLLSHHNSGLFLRPQTWAERSPRV